MFDREVEKDVERLRTILSQSNGIEMSRGEAIQVAADFYRKYPALIEYVRSSDFLFRDSKKQPKPERKIINVVPTIKRKLISREGFDPETGSDYEFHRDVMEVDDSVERLTIMLKHGTISDEDKKALIQRFRTTYPKVDKWLNQRAIDKPNDEWSRRFDI